MSWQHINSTFSVECKRTLCVQSQHSLNSHINAPKLVALKHDLAHLLAVPQRVHGRLGQENFATSSVDLELLVEGKVPQVLHVVPLLDDAVLHGIADLQHGSGSGSLVAAHDILDDHVALAGAALFLGTQDRSAHDGRVLELGEVLGCVADLKEAGTAIENCLGAVLES